MSDLTRDDLLHAYEAMRRALEAARPFFEPEPSYGTFHGGDPRLFSPDPDASTEQERASHAEDCAKWDAGEITERPVSGWNEDGTIHVTRSAYGLGIYQFDPPDNRATRELIDAALSAPAVEAVKREWDALRQRAETAEAEALRNLEALTKITEPGRVGARYRTLERLAGPEYSPLSSRPVEEFVEDRITRLEAELAAAREKLKRYIEKNSEYRGNFLWPPDGDPIKEHGYELLNAVTEEMRKIRWDALLDAIRDEAREDTERLYHLEAEYRREREAIERGEAPPNSLFRRNQPITRATIDEARRGAK